jgi:hypothetical protein
MKDRKLADKEDNMVLGQPPLAVAMNGLLTPDVMTNIVPVAKLKHVLSAVSKRWRRNNHPESNVVCDLKSMLLIEDIHFELWCILKLQRIH